MLARAIWGTVPSAYVRLFAYPIDKPPARRFQIKPILEARWRLCLQSMSRGTVSLSHSYASKKNARLICVLTVICGRYSNNWFWGGDFRWRRPLRECTRRSDEVEGLEIRWKERSWLETTRDRRLRSKYHPKWHQLWLQRVRLQGSTVIAHAGEVYSLKARYSKNIPRIKCKAYH